jgi:hypothetical protein
MRAWIDWIVPIGIGVSLSVLVMVVGEALDWSSGAQGVLALAGITVGVATRFWIHDYNADLEAERVRSAR